MVAAFVVAGTGTILWSLLLLLLELVPFYGRCFCFCWDCYHFMVAAFVAARNAVVLNITTQVMKFGSCLLTFRNLASYIQDGRKITL